MNTRKGGGAGDRLGNMGQRTTDKGQGTRTWTLTGHRRDTDAGRDTDADRDTDTGRDTDIEWDTYTDRETDTDRDSDTDRDTDTNRDNYIDRDRNTDRDTWTDMNMDMGNYNWQLTKYKSVKKVKLNKIL
jgi:hypothetical protein